MDNTAAKKGRFGESVKAFLKKDSFKAITVLVIIALLSSLILSVVHRFTVVDESARLREQISAVYPSSAIKEEIKVSGYKNIEKSQILNAFIAEDGAWIIVSKSEKAYNASVGIALIVIIKDGKIAKVSDYASSETPGLGTRALKESYLAQYVGIEAKDLTYQIAYESLNQESGTRVDFITGATKSSTGVKIAIEAAATFYVREAQE